MFFFLNIDPACMLPMFAGLLGAFILGWLLRHLFFGNNQLALLQEENKNLKYEHDFEMSKKNANYSNLENKHFDLKYSFSKVNEEMGTANKKIEALSSALAAEKLKPPIEKIVEVPKEIIVEDFEKINQLKSALDLHIQMLEEERSKPPKELVIEKPYENVERINQLQSELDLHKQMLEEERSKPSRELVIEKPYENLERINQLQSELDLHKEMLEEERSRPTRELMIEKPYDNMEMDSIPSDLLQPHAVFFSPEEKGYVLGDILKNYIDRAGEYLSHHPEAKLLVIGYTDNIGGIEENRWLSEERASFIKNELSLLGVDGNRIETLGRGMMDPIGDNGSEEGRSKNRRVSIQII